MTKTQHGVRIGLLLMLAVLVLGWLSAHTPILFADGLRYIAQAQMLDRGELSAGLIKAIDHPAYPLAITLAHWAAGGASPESWQAAGQAAAALAGVLLVIPLYLVALELFGSRAAWLGVALTFIVPLTGRTFADCLSESAFLFFWTWALWGALKFLKAGRFAWLPITIAFSGLAYLTRPEGLLLPAALVSTLCLLPLLRSTRMNWPRWTAAMAFLVGGAIVLVVPYAVAKGGLGTKPAVAKILGTAAPAAADAVERARPLEAGEGIVKTHAAGLKVVFEAIRDAVTLPLLPFAIWGLVVAIRAGSPHRRVWLFLAIMLCAATFALIRLFATGGYCTPRHSLIIALLLIPAAAFGVQSALGSISAPARWFGLGDGRLRPGPAVWVVASVAYLAYVVPATLAPVNEMFKGYRSASAFVAANVPAGEKVADVTGWTQFYAQRPGYTFADIIQAPGDPNLRWVVVRDAHLNGPWPYCAIFRDLTRGLTPKATFPETYRRGIAQVYVFEIPDQVASRAGANARTK